MANYKQMYIDSFTAMQRCMEILQEAQLATEEEYMNCSEEAEASRSDVSSDKKIIGNNIRDLRERKLMSKEQMAEIMNISPSRLLLLEYGEENASLDSLCRLSNYFHVPVDSFLVASGYKYIDKPDKHKMLYILPKTKR